MSCRPRLRGLLLLACLVVLGRPAGGVAAAPPAPVTLYAAASLSTALQELAEGPATEHGLDLRLALAGSSVLARQIVEGAPADLFLSANVEWMDYLQERGLIVPATRVDLLANSLVIVAPRGEAFAVRVAPGFDFAAAFAGHLALADPDHMPAGLYARQALQALGWWPVLAGRVAPVADVRAALAYVERGECAAGIVYATDAAASHGVEVLAAIPDTLHAPIIYPVALVQGRDSPAARGALALLQGEEAARRFAQHGFIVLGREAAVPDSLHHRRP